MEEEKTVDKSIGEIPTVPSFEHVPVMKIDGKTICFSPHLPASPSVLDWLTWDRKETSKDSYEGFVSFIESVSHSLDKEYDYLVLYHPTTKRAPLYLHVLGGLVQSSKKFDCVCLSHYMTSWNGAMTVEDTPRYKLCNITDGLHEVSAWFIPRHVAEKWCSMYLRPLKYQASFSFNDKMIWRNQKCFMLHVPVFYRTDEERYKNYYQYYGLN